MGWLGRYEWVGITGWGSKKYRCDVWGMHLGGCGDAVGFSGHDRLVTRLMLSLEGGFGGFENW